MTIQEDLTVLEALEAILDTVSELQSERVPLLDSLQRILAQPIKSETDLPPFSNSSMDGYAVIADDIKTATTDDPVTLPVVADIAAGKVLGDTTTLADPAVLDKLKRDYEED